MSLAEDLLDPQGISAVSAECVAFVGDNQTHGVVEAVTREYFAEPIVRDGSVQQVIEFLSESPPPQVLIVDISDAPSPLTAIMSLTAALTDDTRIIGIGAVNDITLYREIIDSGATDYLVKPVTEKALGAALQRTDEPKAPVSTEPQVQKQERIAVIGSRGGAGASSIASNIAWTVAEDLKLKTALIDLDLEFGTIALSLDLEPTRGLRDALENPARIDSLFISSATAKLTDNLNVMATEENLTGEIHYNPSAVDVLFEALGRTNDVLVVDVPRHAYGVRQRVMELASHIILVTELSLSGLRDSIRLLSNIEDAANDAPITVIANRTGNMKQAMPPSEFQKALGRKINLQIPEEPKQFTKAANTGQPVVQSDKRSKASRALNRLVKKTIKIEAKPEEKGTEKPKKGFKLFKKG